MSLGHCRKKQFHEGSAELQMPRLRSVEKHSHEGSVEPQIPPPGFAPVGACDFFNFRCRLRPESSQEYLPTSIAGVLRLRAIKPPVCDRSAKRFAQDDDFVGGCNIAGCICRKHETLKRQRLSGEQYYGPGEPG